MKKMIVSVILLWLKYAVMVWFPDTQKKYQENWKNSDRNNKNGTKLQRICFERLKRQRWPDEGEQGDEENENNWNEQSYCYWS